MKPIRFVSCVLALFSLLQAYSQQMQLSPLARISVLTCGPGTDLYASFGHSAFRVQDPANRIDWVYNYGTFDFNTPNFYLKFARGQLRYALSRQQFTDFLYTYQFEQRWVREQLLDIGPEQKAELFEFLEWNFQPEHRYYQYDFLAENCATKIPSVLQSTLAPSLEFNTDHLEGTHTFRQLIQQNLEWNTWSSFGIDLALGSVVDRVAEPGEYLFLPEYVRLQVRNSLLGGNPLVERERTILDLDPAETVTYFTATPLFWALVLFALTIAITWIDSRNGSRSRGLDFLLFFLTGASGLVIFFLWFLTEHSTTLWNANILWAFPLNIGLAFLLLRKGTPPAWLRKYLLGLLLLLILCVPLWAFGIQAFAPVLPVIWGAVLLRYLFLLTYFRQPS